MLHRHSTALKAKIPGAIQCFETVLFYHCEYLAKHHKKLVSNLGLLPTTSVTVDREVSTIIKNQLLPPSNAYLCHEPTDSHPSVWLDKRKYLAHALILTAAYMQSQTISFSIVEKISPTEAASPCPQQRSDCMSSNANHTVKESFSCQIPEFIII